MDLNEMEFDSITTKAEYEAAHAKSVADPEGFWGDRASSFTWRKKWDTVLKWDFDGPNINWFVGGKLNITENCLDRHLAERGDQAAMIWEANEPGDPAEHITYKDLHDRVCRYANVLKRNGAKKGDRICIYMPMVPDLAVAVLACARIGAIHSVVFAGFSAQSIADRIGDAQCSMVLTSDGMFRGAKKQGVKSVVDEALLSCPSVQRVIVARRTGDAIAMQDGRDVWLHTELEHVDANCPAEPMDSEDPLFILYTSGSTGKPKGVVHTCGGYMVYAEYTFRNVFQYKPGEVYWCTADVGWVTGHSYIIYGPLLTGATTLMFEGIPTYPDAGRFWQVIDKHKVNIFYTAPTAIRSLMAQGDAFVECSSLSSLRVIGSVGEPINEEAWHWYKTKVGHDRCPIVDTWWQTETGATLMTPLPGAHALKPGSAAKPFFSIVPQLVDDKGTVLEGATAGNLCILDSWPGQMRTVYGDHARFVDTYFRTYPGKYFTGDGCRRDEDSYYWITGRVDDVINVSGHRLGTAEVESALVAHPKVAESAVVGYPHHIKGQGIYAYVSLMAGETPNDDLRKELVSWVRKEIGPIATPDVIQFAPGLPKTRSGKIMRRILRKIAENDFANLGDTSTLADPAVVDDLVKNRASK